MRIFSFPFLGNHDISDEEAVTGWYRQVYQPLIRIIRKHEILKNFPGRTEMDLYLWIIEHRWYLTEEQKKKVTLEAAATNFVNQFSTRPFHHLKQAWTNLMKKLFGKFK